MEDAINNFASLSVRGLIWTLKRDINKINEKNDNYKYPKTVKQILAKRNLSSMALDDYLYPTLRQHTPDPFTLHDMKKATNIIFKTIIENKKIGILGDYDVDGATSSALIYNYLFEINLTKTDVFIPNREKDGYGFSENALNFFKKKKTNLVLCLDCGTNDTKTVSKAHSIGIKVIIIDHHEQKEKDDIAVLINPKKKSDKSGLNYLATVGLVFLFVIALNRKLRESSFFNLKNKEPNIQKYLDLVAIGTICDLVPLKKINRLFVKKGILELNKKNNKGLGVLIDELKIKQKVDTSEIGFYLGPCINAPGRVGEASLGFKLLSLGNENSFQNISYQLLENNKIRKTLENIACKQAKEKLSKLIIEQNESVSKFIFLYDQSWHQGIIGIIASKLTKEYNVPSIIVSLKKNNFKGSIRSIDGINAADIIQTLNKKGYLKNGGGHNLAAGFTLKNDCIKTLKATLKTYFDKISIKKKQNLKIDAILGLHSISVSLVEKIRHLGPFGQDNEEPLIVLKNIRSKFVKKVGKEKNHVFCILEDIYGQTLSAVAFNQESSLIGEALFSNKVFNVAGKLELYKSDQKISPQLIIEDILIL